MLILFIRAQLSPSIFSNKFFKKFADGSNLSGVVNTSNDQEMAQKNLKKLELWEQFYQSTILALS